MPGSIRKMAWLMCLGLAAPSHAQDDLAASPGLDLICPLVEHERRHELEDSEVELELARNEYRARARVFEMIDQLWTARAIEQEIFLDYRRLRDRARVQVDRLTALVAQRKSIAEQYALTCAGVRGESVDDLEERIEALQADYRRLDCDVLAADAAIAGIDFEFDQAMLAATRSLNERNVKTRYDLVIDEYDLSQSKARSESYRRRARECKERLSD